MEKVKKPEGTGGSWGLTDDFAKIQLKRIQPAKIIDFGAGMGKYGFMAREVLGPNIYILAIEVFEPSVEYLKSQGVYSQVMKIDIEEYGFDNYNHKADLAIFGDVLEHLEKNKVREILRAIKISENYKYIMIVLPLGDCPQGHSGGNKAEEHKSYFNEKELSGMIEGVGFTILQKLVVNAKGPNGDYKKVLLLIK